MKRLYLIFGLVIFALPIHADFASDLEKAKKGDPEAQNTVGVAYYDGKGVAQDYTQAVYWYRKAAEQGYFDAQNDLGTAYYNGKGVPQDYTQAVYWFRKAAEQGNKPAIYNLGFAYENGKGVPQDYTQAMYWYKKAVDEGYNSAKSRYDDLRAKGYTAALQPLETSAFITQSSEAPTSVVKSQPPILSLVENSLQLIDSNGNKTIDANESCTIRFQVTNRGKSLAKQCQVKVHGTGSVAGLAYSGKDMPQLEAGATQTIEIPVTSDLNTQDGQVTFTIEVTEPNGFGIDPMTLTVNTRAFDAPLLKVVDYAISGNGKLQRKLPFGLQLLLQNIKYGKAEDVDVTISLPSGVLLNDGQEKTHFTTFNGGDKKVLNYELVVSGNYANTTVPVKVSIREKHGRFAENRTIDLQLNQQLASSTSLVLQGESNHQNRGDIQIGTIERRSTTEINSIEIVNAFSVVENSSVLSLYNNEFGKLVMPDKDESFPYALFRVSIQGDKNQVRMAKQHLMLDMGQLFQTEKTVTSYNNIVLFLVPNNARNIYITCGDGCEKQLIYSGRLESNKIYDGLIEIK